MGLTVEIINILEIKIIEIKYYCTTWSYCKYAYIYINKTRVSRYLLIFNIVECNLIAELQVKIMYSRIMITNITTLSLLHDKVAFKTDIKWNMDICKSESC